MPPTSAGCRTCKTRRIKCDEAKPRCQNCIKARRICAGASAAKRINFYIHDENPYASGNIKRPRGPRSNVLAQDVHPSLQMRALEYYLQCHLQAPAGMVSSMGGLSECVCTWVGSGRKSLMVDLALSCTALAVFARAHDHQPAAVEAASVYGHLLRTAHERIAEVDFNEQDVDACLLTIFLMGRYEGIMNCPDRAETEDSFSLLPNRSHHEGAKAVLAIWYRIAMPKVPSPIVKQTRRGLIRCSLLNGRPLPEWVMHGERFGEQGRDLEWDRVWVGIVTLHCMVKLDHEKNSLSPSRVKALTAEARELDDALQRWAAQLTCEYSYRQHILTDHESRISPHIYSSSVYVYSSIDAAATWGQYFASRMLILNIVLRLLELQHPHISSKPSEHEAWLDSTTHFNAMARSLASTVPFGLGLVKRDSPDSTNNQAPITVSARAVRPYLASLVVWPVTVGSSISRANGAQTWLKSEMARLAVVTGDGILACAETNQWIVL